MSDLKQSFLDGLAQLSVDLDPTTVDQVLAFLHLLFKWNRTYNLTAIRSLEEMVRYHLLDACAGLPYLKEGGPRLVDVGSGSGVPGLIIAIVHPQWEVHLLDKNQKKIAFLRQVVIELGLKNVILHRCLLNSFSVSPPLDSAICRAFAQLAEFSTGICRVLKPGGYLYAMKGVYPSAEISQLPPEFVVEKIAVLQVPRLQAERHLVVLRYAPVSAKTEAVGLTEHPFTACTS